MFMKKILSIFLMLAAVISTNAQVKFSATAKKAVEVGEVFQLSFSVNSKATGFRAPRISGLQVISGPSTSTSSQYRIVNGRTSQSLTTTYNYNLRAVKEGTFTIGTAKVTVAGKNYKSNVLRIKVVKASNKSGKAATGTSADELFVRVILNKSSVYLGEPITATIKIYTKVPLLDFKDMKFPSYSGFWSQDILSPTNIALQRETYKGKLYDAAILKQTLLFPQKTGKLTIDPYELELTIKEKSGKARNFFGQIVDRYIRVDKKLKSYPNTINVKPLSGNQPTNFSGLTGKNIKLSVTTDSQEIKQDEGITLKVKISGSGNLKLIDEIPVNFPASFEKYPPKIKENISNTSAGSSGSKTFEYFFVARDPGSYTISPIEFSYFDIQLKRYKTLTSKPFTITVSKGDGRSVAGKTNSSSQSEIENLGNDIRFIKQDNLELYKKGNHYAGSWAYFLTFPFGIFLLILLLLLRRKSIKLNADTADNRTRKASKLSKKRLKVASKYLKENNTTAFYKEILQATWGYLGDKFHLPVSEITKEKITAVLSEKGIEQELVNRLNTMISTCEFAQYAPVGAEGSPEKIYNEAGQIIDAIEKSKL